MSEEPLVTKTGKILTDADIEALSAEAEQGYCVVTVGVREGTGTRRMGGDVLCGHVLPCPHHPQEQP